MELVTVAKPYANAIFAIAEQDGTQTDWQTMLSAAVRLATDAQLQIFIDSPKVDKSHKSSAIQILVSQLLERELHVKETTFLELLLTNNRLNALPSMLTLFEQHLNASDKSRFVNVVSAYPLNTAAEQQLVGTLSKKYNAAIQIKTSTDAQLVGGIVLKEGDKVVDMSIKARSDALNLRLSNTH